MDNQPLNDPAPDVEPDNDRASFWLWAILIGFVVLMAGWLFRFPWGS
jgi:hypothetical protein